MTDVDRVALVTGTSGGIGAAIARRLLSRGWAVIGVARRDAHIDDARYEHVALDLADASALVTTIGTYVAPRITAPAVRRVALVNNAAAPGLLRPIERLPPDMLARVYAVNVAAPIWLMGFVIAHAPATAALRIVNVSSGAAVHAFPGMAAYGSSKAGLRMAGMIAGAELTSPQRDGGPRVNASVVSYEPGVVDTDMQTFARSQSRADFPWVTVFQEFAARGLIVPVDVPAGEIVRFVERDDLPPFSEHRLAR